MAARPETAPSARRRSGRRNPGKELSRWAALQHWLSSRKFAPLIADAMAPEVQHALLKSLPSGLSRPHRHCWTSKSQSPPISPKRCRRSPPRLLATIRNKIGIAVAIYATEHPGDELESQACWVDIAAAANAGIAAEGLDVRDDPRSTYWQMILSGLELYRAGLGAERQSRHGIGVVAPRRKERGLEWARAEGMILTLEKIRARHRRRP